MKGHRQRALGQNFLVAEDIARRIAEVFLAIRGTEELAPTQILEIGPGDGALTRHLPRPLTLAEFDPDLITRWKSETGVTVIAGDAVQTVGPWIQAQDTQVAVISNLPYNASTAILAHLVEVSTKVPCMVLMFQKEVAQKLRAEPGERDVGPLSLITQNLYDISRVLQVNPGSFRPRPNVDSEVVALRRRAEPRLPPGLAGRLGPLAFRAFAHRRKMLRQNLANAPQTLATRRPHELSWQDWRTLLESDPT